MATALRKRLQTTLRNKHRYITNTNFGRGVNLIRPLDLNNPTVTMTLTLDGSPKTDDNGVIITLSNVVSGNGVSVVMGYPEACILAEQIKEMYNESLANQRQSK